MKVYYNGEELNTEDSFTIRSFPRSYLDVIVIVNSYWDPRKNEIHNISIVKFLKWRGTLTLIDESLNPKQFLLDNILSITIKDKL